MASSNINIEALYKEVIMDHYKNPANKGIPQDDDSYHIVNLKNPTCGDDVTIALKLVGETLQDIRHDGIGCSICCSSASVMSELLAGRTVSEAEELTNNFYSIVKGETLTQLQEDDMEEAMAYSGVASFPARIKCATIPWKALETALEEILED